MTSASLEARVREAVLAWVVRGLPFRASDVAAALPAAPAPDVARCVAALVRDGLLREFGYRRRLARTSVAGVHLSAIEYAPPSQVRRRGPTRRPQPTVGGSPRGVARQAAAVDGHLARAGREFLRAAELLDAIDRRIGRAALHRVLGDDLGVSPETARRMIRVARTVARHPAAERLAALRPSVLYRLSAPSFPAELLAAVLRRGALTVEGVEVPLERLTVPQLRRWVVADARRRRRVAALRRAVEAAADPEVRVALERRLGALLEWPITAVPSETERDRSSRALADLSEFAARLAEAPELAVDHRQRAASAAAIRRLLERLEEEEE